MLEVDLLASVPMFEGASQEVLRKIAADLQVQRLAAGEILMRQGEPGDSMHIVRTGRLEIDIDGSVVRSSTAGEVIGELSILSSRPRTATVRAVRDTEILTLSGQRFEALLSSEPDLMRAVLRELAHLLGESAAIQRGPRRGGVLAFVGSEARPGRSSQVRSMARQIAASLNGFEPTTCLDGQETSSDEWPQLLDHAEHQYVWVVLDTSEPEPWREFALRQADRVFLVVDSASVPPPGVAAPRGTDVVFAGSVPSVTRWVQDFRPRGWHHVAPGSPSDIERLARRVAGHSTGLVLSGGGARGLAHLGVVDEFVKAGHVIDRVGGTSMGSLVGGLLAMGVTTREAESALERELVQRNPFRDYTWPRHSIIRGEKARAMLTRIFGSERYETQSISAFCVSADLIGAEEVVHRSGPIKDAVGMSMSLPGVAPPRSDSGRIHVDGGVLNNLPVDVMAADREGPIIAVDVMRPFTAPTGMQRGNVPTLPGIVDVIGRSIVLGSRQKAEVGRELARCVVTPGMEGVGMFDFARMGDIIEMGRRAARQCLESEDLSDVL